MKILLATDGSRHALEAASFLRSHLDPAAPFRITLVAVPDPAGSPVTSNGSHRQLDDPTRRRAQANQWLERTREMLGPGLTPVGSRILHGAAEEVLVGEAREHDLVVGGAKGSGAAPFFELGRVARALLRHADCSVLLVRDHRSKRGNGRAANDAEGSPGFKVLISTTDAAGEGPPAGWSLLQPFALSGASLEVVTVLDRATRSSGAGKDGSVDPCDPARRWLSRNTGRLRVPSGEPRWALLEGRPGAEIERRALETGADLIVVGARRGASPGPGPLGSTARELVWRAPCSVLTVRHRQVVPTIPVGMTANLRTNLGTEISA